MSDHLHDEIFGRSLDDYRREAVVTCVHGRPALRIFLVDRTRKTVDGYGDIVGPVGMDTIDTMTAIRDEHTADHPGDRGRFVLAFVHTDRCRTEQTPTEPEES